jgi:hypothetical protein
MCNKPSIVKRWLSDVDELAFPVIRPPTAKDVIFLQLPIVKK